MDFFITIIILLVLLRALTYDPLSSIDWKDMDKYTDSLEEDENDRRN